MLPVVPSCSAHAYLPNTAHWSVSLVLLVLLSHNFVTLRMSLTIDVWLSEDSAANGVGRAKRPLNVQSLSRESKWVSRIHGEVLMSRGLRVYLHS